MSDQDGVKEGGRSNRQLHTKVKTAKGRKSSSTRWLKRQLNDVYVKRSREEGYRSRAAYKLLEIDDKFSFLNKANVVVDLGAAPGGWSQVVVERGAKGVRVFAIDLLPIEPLAGVDIIQGDFTSDTLYQEVLKELEGKHVDVVLSDMAAGATGHKQTDHLKIMGLCEIAYDFARQVLQTDGVFVAKLFQGGAENDLLSMLKQDFTRVKHIKPPASRKESSEMYIFASGFRGIS